MKLGGGDGANTKTGRVFERTVDLRTSLLSKAHFKVLGNEVMYKGEPIGLLFSGHTLYSDFFESYGISWRTVLSRKLLPDEALYLPSKRTLFIIEKKFQQGVGSVDEKLQTCGFKRRQYERLCKAIPGCRVEYIYILNDWFRNQVYRDVLAYINEVGCHYRFNSFPYDLFGIPE